MATSIVPQLSSQSKLKNKRQIKNRKHLREEKRKRKDEHFEDRKDGTDYRAVASRGGRPNGSSSIPSFSTRGQEGVCLRGGDQSP